MSAVEQVRKVCTVGRKAPLPLGTNTQWGTIEAVGITGGERYYWMANGNCVAMIPAFMVEDEVKSE